MTCEHCLRLLWNKCWAAVKDDERVMKELEIQRSRDPRLITEKDFLRECAWSIYGQHTKAQKIYLKWLEATKAFRIWDLKEIVENADQVYKDAIAFGPQVEKTEAKVSAIIEIARRNTNAGWDSIRRQLLEGLHEGRNGNIFSGPGLIPYLDKYPFIGKTIASYIAKNIGFDWAKDDIHLKWLSETFGYGRDQAGVQRFALSLSDLTGERISVVETVLWNACERKAPIGFLCPKCGFEFKPKWKSASK